MPCFCINCSSVSRHHRKRVRHHLKNIAIAEIVASRHMVDSIVKAFVIQNAPTCSWYRLTQFYVAACYERWKSTQNGDHENYFTMLEGVPSWATLPCPFDSTLEATFRHLMDKLRFWKFPLVLTEEDWNMVVQKAWLAFRCKFIVEPSSITREEVVDLLEDMEEESAFLSISNHSLCVKVKSSAFDSLRSPRKQARAKQRHRLALSHATCDNPVVATNPNVARREDVNGYVNTALTDDDERPLLDEVGMPPPQSKGGRKKNAKPKPKKDHGSVHESQGIQSKRSANVNSNIFERKEPLQTGTRVYARWPDNGFWYWGYVIAVNPNKRKGQTYGVSDCVMEICIKIVNCETVAYVGEPFLGLNHTQGSI